MFTVIGFMIAGILIGYAARRISFSWTPRLITGLIWALLFLLGWEVGHNKEVIASLPTLGLAALLLTLAALLGSCLAAWALWKLVNKRRTCVSEEGNGIPSESPNAGKGEPIHPQEDSIERQGIRFHTKEQNATCKEE